MSGTAALRFGNLAQDSVQGLVGVGLSAVGVSGEGHVGPQFLIELGYKAGFVQFRIVPIIDRYSMAMLLAGWKFSGER